MWHCSANLKIWVWHGSAELLICWIQCPDWAVCQNHSQKPGPKPIGSLENRIQNEKKTEKKRSRANYVSAGQKLFTKPLLNNAELLTAQPILKCDSNKTKKTAFKSKKKPSFKNFDWTSTLKWHSAKYSNTKIYYSVSAHPKLNTIVKIRLRLLFVWTFLRLLFTTT